MKPMPEKTSLTARSMRGGRWRLRSRLRSRRDSPPSAPVLTASGKRPVKACETRLRFVPQARQKLAPSMFCAPHFGQYIARVSSQLKLRPTIYVTAPPTFRHYCNLIACSWPVAAGASIFDLLNVRCRAFPRCCVEHAAGRDRDVERSDAPAQGDAHECIATLAHQAAQALAFAAEQQRRGPRPIPVCVFHLRIGGRADCPPAALFQLFDEPHDVRHARHTHIFERARRSLRPRLSQTNC